MKKLFVLSILLSSIITSCTEEDIEDLNLDKNTSYNKTETLTSDKEEEPDPDDRD